MLGGLSVWSVKGSVEPFEILVDFELELLVGAGPETGDEFVEIFGNADSLSHWGWFKFKSIIYLLTAVFVS